MLKKRLKKNDDDNSLNQSMFGKPYVKIQRLLL